MFGYVIPARDKLDQKEFQRFQSVYCGSCFALGRRYGFFARFLLNYDFTFLAILLSDPEETTCQQCRCIAHPFRRRCVARRTDALDRAADLSVVLAWWQLCDHVQDSGAFSGLKYRVAQLLLRGAYQKARCAAAQFDQIVEQRLSELTLLEQSECASIDAAAQPFALLMAAIAEDIPDGKRRRVLSHILYHLGRWIYLIDAADDLEKDTKRGEYNPLRFRYALTEGTLSPEAKTSLAQTLDLSIREMAAAYELGDFGVWRPILDQVFYAGLYAVGNSVIEGRYRRAAPYHCRRSAERGHHDRSL